MTSVNNQPLISVYKHFNDQEINHIKLNFNYLPSYAKFLLENKLHEFVKQQLYLSKQIQLPLLKFLKDLSEEQLINLGLETTKEFLNSCAENKVDEYIKTSLARWLSNQLPSITKNQIIAEDITLLSFVRRTVFRHFISSYTEDINVATKILDEIDSFTVKIDSISFKTFSNIQQQMFAQAQALARVGNWQWDLKTKKLTWSDELYNIYELEPQSELVSENIGLYNHPEDAELVNKHMRLSEETLSPHDFFYRIIFKDGRQKVLHAKGEIKLDVNKSPVEMFGTLQDVTEQKEKEKELEENKKFIEKIANISPCIIAVYNKNLDKYIFVNNTAERLLGYSAEEFMSKGRSFFYSIMHPDDVKMIKEKNIELIEEANKTAGTPDENIKEFKFRLKHKDGTYRWINTF
ncbi:MAG TPA: PAS domain-containing protein, partial [Parafilimonas sp.]